MYTGYISEVGTVVRSDHGTIIIRAPKTCTALRVGASISVDGTCLSAESVEDTEFVAVLSGETSNRSTLSELAPDALVNLELPIAVGDRLEGHLVQGHTDAVGKVMKVEDEPPGTRVWIRPPERVLADLVPKGSIAINGVSLTIAEVVRDRFSVALVPSTLERTTLGRIQAGTRVNLETDLVGKLVARHGTASRGALARAIAPHPWTGVVSGALGVEKVVKQIAAGGGVIVWDPEREGEGDVVFAGARIKPEHFAFILTEACCHPTVPCALPVLERLEIPRMQGPGDRHGTWMHVSVDLATASGTGVSAAERAATVRRLADPNAVPSDFLAPGHVFPLSARPGGFRERSGHTEATVALCVAAGLPPVGVCCEVMSRDGTMAGPAELERLAVDWGLPMIDIADLVERL